MTTDQSPKILAVSWGRMEVEGLAPGKDFKLYPGGGRAWDWQETGTALRQLVDFALRELRKRDAIAAYRSGRVTLRDFARALGLDVWAAHDLLRAEGVAVSQGDRSETAAALDVVLQKARQPGRTTES